MISRQSLTIIATILSVVLPLLSLPSAVVSQIVWVYIDAGHGGTDGGSSTPITDYSEKHINLQVAEQLQPWFTWLYAVMSRTDNNETITLPARAYEANTLDAHSFVSIHHNAATTPGVQRTETLYSTWPHPEGDSANPPPNPWSHLNRDTTSLLATKIGYRIRDFFHYSLRAPKDTANGITVLSRTYMPSVLTEASFTYEYSEAAKFL